MRTLAEGIAHSLQRGQRPLIISGTGCGSEAVMRAAANVAWALCQEDRMAELCLTVPECNSLGLAFIGGRDLAAAFQAVHDGLADTVIILENDLYRRAESATVEAFLKAAPHVIAIDHLSHATTARAEIVLPAATFAESTGTLINNEGRAQRFYQVFVPDPEIQASWRWLREAMVAAGYLEIEAWQTVDDVASALVEQTPILSPILESAPPATYRMVGQEIPRQSHRRTGRTAVHADVDVNEPQPPDDPDSPLAFSMEGFDGQPPPTLIPRFWAPHWNSVQSLNKFQSEVGGPLRGGDPGRRLIEPAKAQGAAYLDGIPAPFGPRAEEWLVIPQYHIFGSEELSVLTPSIAELAPRPYLAIDPSDADTFQVKEGDELALHLNGETYRLRVRLAHGMPDGTVGLSVGLPGSPVVDLPAWGTITGGRP
jgi:NADH-quinone oxidoreductase subunit G